MHGYPRTYTYTFPYECRRNRPGAFYDFAFYERKTGMFFENHPGSPGSGVRGGHMDNVQRSGDWSVRTCDETALFKYI